MPARLLAAGRDCDIFEHGPGLVLRRSRTPRSLAAEAAVMEHARAHGYPVPVVHDVSDDGRDVVLERVDGPSMVDAMVRRPWTLRRHAATLAGLHDRLHAIPAPPGLPPGPVAGDRLLHLDLHPLNVLLGPTGPVVIDWTNAAAGDPSADLAFTWVIVAVSEVDGGVAEQLAVRAFRSLFLRAFLARVDAASAAACLRPVAERRTEDPNVRPAEREALLRFVERAERRGSGRGRSSP